MLGKSIERNDQDGSPNLHNHNDYQNHENVGLFYIYHAQLILDYHKYWCIVHKMNPMKSYYKIQKFS